MAHAPPPPSSRPPSSDGAAFALCVYDHLGSVAGCMGLGILETYSKGPASGIMCFSYGLRYRKGMYSMYSRNRGRRFLVSWSRSGRCTGRACTGMCPQPGSLILQPCNLQSH